MKIARNLALCIALIGTTAAGFSSTIEFTDPTNRKPGNQKIDNQILNGEKIDNPILDSEKLGNPMLSAEKLTNRVLAPLNF